MKAYPITLKALAEAEVDLTVVMVSLAATTSAFNAAHDFLSDITVLGTDDEIPGTDVGVVGTNAMFITTAISEATAIELTGVGTGSPVAFVAFVDTGVAGTSRLLYYYDRRAGNTPVAFTNDGGTVKVWFPGGFYMGLGG